MAVVVRVDSMLRVRVADAPPDFVARLKGALTVEAPPSGRRGPPGASSIAFWRLEKGDLVAPRGSLAQVREAATFAGVELQWDKQVVTRARRRVSLADLGRELRDYQAAAVEQMLARVQLFVEAPCGSGKSTIIGAALVASGEPGLVVAPTIDIVDQFVELLPELGARKVRRVRGAAGWRPLAEGEIAVATAQSFSGSAVEDGLFSSAGAVAFDEAHHTPTPSWAAIVARCRGRYRWATSATREREDGGSVALPFLIGPTYTATTARDLIDLGFLVMPTVVPVATGRTADPETNYVVKVQCTDEKCGRKTEHRSLVAAREATCPGYARRECGESLEEAAVLESSLDWATTMRDFAGDEGRNSIAVELAVEAFRLKRRTLILVARVDHAPEMVRRLRLRGVPAALATGETNKRERKERIEQLRTGQIPTLVSTQMADEGLDVPELDCLILMAAGKAKGRATQRAGRTARPAGEKPLVFDLVDASGEFVNQWWKRSAGYRDVYGSACIFASRPVGLDEALGVLRGTAGVGEGGLFLVGTPRGRRV